MIKKLDKLIIKTFIGPFIITFFIAVFVLMMQILWKYIDDLVGKGLDFIIILEFIWYAGASLLALAMPIAILISSIMTFGNLGESFELVAVKSSGISLLRFMRPLVYITFVLCGITFLFANYIIPYSQLKFVTLYNDIFYKKPAFDLSEGVFYTNIPNYAIRIGSKDKDGKTIHNVLIYEQSNYLQDNAITAKKGVMEVSEDKNFLAFHLTDGYRYQERGSPTDTTNEFIRLKFKEFKKLFDLSGLQKQTTSDSVFKDNQKMLSARQLNKNIDSLHRYGDSMNKKALENTNAFLNFKKPSDSLVKTLPASNHIFKLPDSVKQQVNDRALNVIADLKNSFLYTSYNTEQRLNEIKVAKIEWHRKYAFSIACLILFFIGAPLGSIIRKGGLGMPLVVAICFFLIFHLLNMFGEKFVNENLLSPVMGMWLAPMVLAPVGIFLTYKAVHDAQLFNKEFYTRLLKKIKTVFVKSKPNLPA